MNKCHACGQEIKPLVMYDWRHTDLPSWGLFANVLQYMGFRLEVDQGSRTLAVFHMPIETKKEQ